MSRPHLSIELAGCGSLVRGYGSRDLVEEVSGRPPVWMSRLRGWSIQEWTARKVVALAETRGYDITIIEARSPAARSSSPTERPDVEVDGHRDVGLEVDHADIEELSSTANSEQGLW